jgi:hypothetical protein
MDRKTKLTGHEQRNKELLLLFRAKQVNLDEKRSIDLHFWAWSQSDSVRLAHELYRRGFTILLLKPAILPDDPERWNVEAGTRSTISSIVDSKFTEMLVDLASSFNADYDGWGTLI